MKKKSSKSNIKKLLRYLKEYKGTYILCFTLLLISQCSIIVYGGLIGKTTDFIIDKDLINAIKTLFFYLIVMIINSLVARLAEYITRKSEVKVANKIAYDTYSKAMELPAYAYEEMSSGEVINRITNDTQNISDSINGLIDLFTYLLLAFVLLIYI